jgi:hypothetical protein
MSTNPYQPPSSSGDPPFENPTIRYRVFRVRSASFRYTGEASREEVRQEAQRAIETEIGPDNVISIIEHAGAFEVFSIVIWYRVAAPQRPS